MKYLPTSQQNVSDQRSHYSEDESEQKSLHHGQKGYSSMPKTNKQSWNSEQISDFVRKLGFLDKAKEEGKQIKHFLHINEVSFMFHPLEHS